LSAKEIVNLVHYCTKVLINTKNKKGIVKKAIMLLKTYGYELQTQTIG